MPLLMHWVVCENGIEAICHYLNDFLVLGTSGAKEVQVPLQFTEMDHMAGLPGSQGEGGRVNLGTCFLELTLESSFSYCQKRNQWP